MRSSISSSKPIELALGVVLVCLSFASTWVDAWSWQPGMSDGIAPEMQRKVESTDPEWVFVGNSELEFGIDEGVLAEALGPRAVVLSQRGSRSSHWYLMLKHHVFGRGARPHTVVVFGDRDALIGRPPRADNSTALVQHMRGDENEVVRKVFADSGGSFLVALWNSDRERKRRRWLDRVAELGLDLVFDASGAELRAAASEQVFAQGQMRRAKRPERALPVAELAPERAAQAGTRAALEATLLPEIIDLCRRHEARLIFVSAPLRADSPRYDTFRNPALPGYLAEHGATWIPADSFEIPASDYVDSYHLNHEASRRFTRDLAARLERL